MTEAEKLARAIMDRIERDGCVHLSSIEEEVAKGMHPLFAVTPKLVVTGDIFRDLVASMGCITWVDKSALDPFECVRPTNPVWKFTDEDS